MYKSAISAAPASFSSGVADEAMLDRRNQKTLKKGMKAIFVGLFWREGHAGRHGPVES